MDPSKTLNTGKTKTVIFKSRYRKITKHLNFCISGQKIVPVDSVKYLGLTKWSSLENALDKFGEKTKQKYWLTLENTTLCT